MKSSLICFVLVYIILFHASCWNAGPTMDNIAETSPRPVVNAMTIPRRVGITAEVRIFAHWWSPRQLAEKWPPNNPPDKEDYVELQSWDASDGNSPHPDKIDIDCRINNATANSKRLQVQVSVGFKVASFTRMTNLGPHEDFEAQLRMLKWSRVRTVGTTVIDIEPDQSKDVQFRDFDLNQILGKYFESKNDLWPWRLRVVAKVLDGNGFFVSEKIIDLVPGD